jgi:hypothetical protein
MSEITEDDTADEPASDEPASDEPASDETADEPVDQLGIPMSREPTIDDVRTDGEDHRRMAFGCSLLVVVATAAFWLLRVVLSG